MAERIALIVGTNLLWAPFYYRYEKILVENNVPFDLILWNRENIDEQTSASNVYECRVKDAPNNKNPKKAWKFLIFGNFVKKIIKRNKYEKLLFVGTYGCALNICSFYLSKHYKNKIWIDIRDDLYEWFKPFYLTEKLGIDSSFVTTISSHEFTTFLPKHNYLLMHNIDSNAQKMMEEFKHIPDPEGRIRISFIGNVRYYEQNKELITLLGNDARFKLQYYGKGSDALKEYCEEHGIENVDFHGGFKQSDTIRFYEKTDMINNMYGNDTLNLRVALSNKLYYGLFLKLPILVSDNTYMEKLTKEYQIGYSFKNEKSFGDELYDWYNSIQNDTVTARFDDLWSKVTKEDGESIEMLHQFLGI